MRKTPLLAAILALVFTTAPALAQSASPQTPPGEEPAPTPPPHHPTGIKPDDKGPNTPQANAAYQGGGVVLQGPPGAPPPTPQPTPPGQPPANSVPR
jgi:hypothetical protein